MDKQALLQALGQIVAGVAAARLALRDPVAPAPGQPPTLALTGPDAPSYDAQTGRVTADYFVVGHMGAQKGAVYGQWSQCWMIYSMMGATLDDWVVAAPPAGSDPAFSSPTCIDCNARHAWDMNPPWKPAPA